MHQPLGHIYFISSNHKNFLDEGKYLFTFAIVINFQMKCSELFKILRNDGWYAVSQKGSHLKLAHPTKSNRIIFPNHGSQEVGTGLEKKILKDAGIK
jgi:predicted RNA binding protein YcfA (HicA-like mRNA interferase family)